MNRRSRPARRAPRLELLEARALLSALGQASAPDPSSSVFVRFAASDSPSAIAAGIASVHGTVSESFPDGPDLITLGSGEGVDAAIKALQGEPGVVYAQADSIIHSASVPVIPNDPEFPQQTGLSGANDVDIDAPEAWGISTGNPATIIAVLDTGIDLGNPDFAGRIWTNPADDAASGYPGDLHGWNFVSNNADVQDDNGHGTHVSGIIAAGGNDGYGVAGVDWNARIMPLKTLDSTGSGATALAVSAIYYAVAHGAKVINASWGGVAYSDALYDAIAYAGAHNVVFVTAAGNDGTDNDLVTSYPASFRLPNEISVASVDANGNLSSFSNYGPTTVNLAAPGENVISDYPAAFSANRLETLSGTSMSTAYVTGVVALLDGVDPDFTASEVVDRIDSTVKPEPGLAGEVIAGGIVDAYNALLPDASRVAGGVAPAGLPTLTPGASTDAQVRSTILASDEFLAAHGGTGEGFVVGVYEDVLGRYPDSVGMSYWLGRYDSGTTSRYQIAYGILTSFEARTVEVAQWYQQDLGRTADIDTLKADPGVQGWALDLLAGVGDDSVQDAIMASPEYLDGHGGTPASIVAGIYDDLDDRAPTAVEQANWAGLFSVATPDAILGYFQSTPEVFQTEVARWFISDLGRAESVAELKQDPGVEGFATLLTSL